MPDDIADYSNTVFYKIYCNDATVNDLYVGHTTNFVQRKTAHKRACIKVNDANHHFKVYKFIRDNGGWVNWKMKIIGFKDCSDHYEARTVEQNYFETLHATLNSIEPLPKPKAKLISIPKAKEEKPVWYCNLCKTTCETNKAFIAHEETKKHKHNVVMNASVNNEDKTHKKYFCEKCNFDCSKQSDYDRHILTAKHKRLTTTKENTQKNTTTYNCECGKTYKHIQSLYKHKNTCSLITNTKVIPENPEDKPSLMDIVDMLVLQNKELVRQNKELVRQNKENNDTIV